ALHVDAQHAARIRCDMLQRRFGIVEFTQHVHAAFVERLAVERRAHLPRRAFEQRGAESRFQLLDRMGRGRTRNVEHVGSAAEAACFDDAGEELERVETVHGTVSEVLGPADSITIYRRRSTRTHTYGRRDY